MSTYSNLNSQRKQFIMLLTTGAIALTLFFIFRNMQDEPANSPEEITFSKSESNQSDLILSEFDPNELDAKQWQSLGFSEKQAATILKYKEVVGGAFISKEQFKKCYSVSEEKYLELEPFLLLPERSPSSSKAFVSKNFSTPFGKKELRISGRFNPDNLSKSQWENMGFSEKQSEAILKYKEYLGGSFISKEKFKACFIISDENYRKMEPYLLLPEKAPANSSFTGNSTFAKKEDRKINYTTFDPNLLNADDWKALGFSEKQAQVIVNYRDRNLKGSFKTLEDIKNCFVISDQKFEEIKPYIRINPENIQTKNPTAFAKTTEKSEAKTDFSKTDLNQINYRQLIEFGFGEKAAANFIGFRKKLGGFVNTSQIFESYDIDRGLAEKLVSLAPLNSTSVEKYTLADAPESWLKTHPYFRYSADKIIFYRVTNPDDKKIWKFIKVKPEYEAKMRLYLK